MAGQDPDPKLFDQRDVPAAVLLEGQFESLYKNRIPPSISEAKEIGFRESSRPTQMLVVADGDIIRNQINRRSGVPLPLGYDQDTRQTFGNKDFVLNALNYMIDESRLVEIRSREIKLRLLDPRRLESERLRWQTLNILGPVVFVLLIALLKFYLRKRKYAKKYETPK